LVGFADLPICRAAKLLARLHGDKYLAETMIEILEHPTIRRQVQPLSVESYHRLGEQGLLAEKVELLRGVIVQKMSKSPLHCAALRRLLQQLRAICEPRYDLRQEQPLTLADSEPEPDIAVVPLSPDDYATGHPTTALLVVEVAVTTVENDREKAGIYAGAGIPEFWLVLPEQRVVEVYTQPGTHGYGRCQKVSPGTTLTSVTLPQISIEVASLWR
jgi:Uma2 family endonuclease